MTAGILVTGRARRHREALSRSLAVATDHLRSPLVATGIVLVGGALCGAAARAGPVAIAALASLLAGVVVLARPRVAALLAVGLVLSNTPVILARDHGVPGAVAEVVPLLLALAVGYRVFVRREPLVLPPALGWVIAFLVVQILAALSSRDPQQSVGTVQTFAFEGLALFVLVVNAVRGFDGVRAAVLVLVVVAGVLGSLSLVKEVTGDRNQDFGGFATMSKAVIGRGQGDGAPRHAGPIGEQNRWAQTLAMALPLAVAVAATDRSRGARVAAAASAVGIGAGIVLTYSRGAAVGLVLTGLVATVLRWVRPRTALTVAGVTVAVVLLVAPTFAARTTTLVGAFSSVADQGEGAPTTATDTAAEGGADGSVTNRATEAQAALAVFLRHPAVGVGPGLFSSYFQDEARAQGAARIVGVERQAHSLYLGLAAETGVLGLVAFGGTIAAILGPLAAGRRRHLGVRRDVAGLAAGAALSVVTYLTTGLFLHPSYIRFFWLFAALATALGVAVRQSIPPPAELPTGRSAPAPKEASCPAP